MEELLRFMGYMQNNSGTPNELSRRRREDVIRDILGMGTSGLKALDAQKRIKNLKSADRKNKKPTSPGKRFKSRAIQEAMDRARKLAEQPLSPLELGAINNAENDQYMQDRAVARTASTGNAGTYGALMQTSANRRLRNNQTKVSNMSAQRREALRNLNYVAGLSAQEDASIFNNNLDLYRTNLNQFNTESNAIGRGMASSRLSQLGAIDSLIDPFSRLTSRVDFNNINQSLNGFQSPSYYENNPGEVDPYTYDYNNFGEGMNDYKDYIDSVNTGSAFDPMNYGSVPRSKRFFT